MGRLKADLGLDRRGGGGVGESWEISVEPSFLSRTESGETLADVIAGDPVAWLGATGCAKYAGQLPLLVKIVDARDHLSVQVHPTLAAAGLSPDESGKIESWTILDAARGAGIYIGFADGVGRDDVAGCLAAGGALDPLMNFVPVQPGETYVVRPGTPHALGAGLTLVEPQLLVPGKKAVTYRFWDWNRRYDEHGRPSPTGKPRPIDVARSLDATDWTAPRGRAFVDGCRCPRRPVQGAGGAKRDAIAEEGDLAVEWWTGTGVLDVPAFGTAVGLTCVGGRLRVDPALVLRCGESALLPAALGAFRAELDGASVVASRALG